MEARFTAAMPPLPATHESLWPYRRPFYQLTLTPQEIEVRGRDPGFGVPGPGIPHAKPPNRRAALPEAPCCAGLSQQPVEVIPTAGVGGRGAPAAHPALQRRRIMGGCRQPRQSRASVVLPLCLPLLCSPVGGSCSDHQPHQAPPPGCEGEEPIGRIRLWLSGGAVQCPSPPCSALPQPLYCFRQPTSRPAPAQPSSPNMRNACLTPACT